MIMKLAIDQHLKLNPREWQPNNWAGEAGNEDPTTPKKRSLGFDSFTLAPVNAAPINKIHLQMNRENLAQTQYCFDQKTYDAYKAVFVNTMVLGKPSLLLGPPGTIKTSVIGTICDHVGIPLATFDCASMDPMQARKLLLGGSVLSDKALWLRCREQYENGMLDRELSAHVIEIEKKRKLTKEDWLEIAVDAGMKDSETYWQEGLLTKAARVGMVVEIGEINRLGAAALADISNLLGRQIVDAGNGHRISLTHSHPNFRVVASMNPAGPHHPDREPLPEEVHTRFVSYDVDALSRDELYNYMLHQLTGKQPAITLPDGSLFQAQPGINHLEELGIDGDNPELQTFLTRFMDSREIAKQATEKMDGTIQAPDGSEQIMRSDTVEPFVFSRRDVQTFKDRLLAILPQPQTKEIMADRVVDLFREMYASHFVRFNRARGSEVAASVMEAVKKTEMREAFVSFIDAALLKTQMKASGIGPDRIWEEKTASSEQISKWARKLTPYLECDNLCRISSKPEVMWFSLPSNSAAIAKALFKEKVEGQTFTEAVAEVVTEMEACKIPIGENKVASFGIVKKEEFPAFIDKFPELKSRIDGMESYWYCKLPKLVT